MGKGTCIGWREGIPTLNGRRVPTCYGGAVPTSDEGGGTYLGCGRGTNLGWGKEYLTLDRLCCRQYASCGFPQVDFLVFFVIVFTSRRHSTMGR